MRKCFAMLKPQTNKPRIYKASSTDKFQENKKAFIAVMQKILRLVFRQ